MIEIWMIYIIIAILAILMELIIPRLIFINFAFAGIIVSIVSIFWGTFLYLFCLYACIVCLCVLWVKPFLKKVFRHEDDVALNSRFIGTIVKTIEPVSREKGIIEINGEKFEARYNPSEENEEIPVDTEVKIISVEGLVFFVQKV